MMMMGSPYLGLAWSPVTGTGGLVLGVHKFLFFTSSML